MSLVTRIETIGTYLIEAYDEGVEIFRTVGWFEFLHIFRGFNQSVTESFIATFNDHKTRVGDVEMTVDVNFIVEANHLLVYGEIWSKNQRVSNIPWRKPLEKKGYRYKIKCILVSYLPPQ